MKRLAGRYRRKLAIRAKVTGTETRPRVVVNRSNKNLFAQVVDDSVGKTLFSVQTFGKNAIAKGLNKEVAKTLGIGIGNNLKKIGITMAVFDRNGYKYHGVVAAVANGIREQGISL